MVKQVRVRLQENWYGYHPGEIVAIAEEQAKLLKCEILGEWKTFDDVKYSL